MRITIAAIGRLKAGPERELLDRYLDRAAKAGGRIGLSFTIREIAESRAASPATRKADEARAILAAIPAGAVLVALDETGSGLDSRGFASRIGKWRDGGMEDLVLAIGGPDGHGEAVIAKAALRLAFGGMTWPHQLVRLMLAEQLYRVVTILSGHPYHRD